MDEYKEQDLEQQMMAFRQGMTELARKHQLAVMKIAIERVERLEEGDLPLDKRRWPQQAPAVRAIWWAAAWPLKFLASRMFPAKFPAWRRKNMIRGRPTESGRPIVFEIEPLPAQQMDEQRLYEPYRLLPDLTGSSKERMENEESNDPATK